MSVLLPSVSYNPGNKGIHSIITPLAQELGSLPWLQYSFGLARRSSYTNEISGATEVIPEIWQDSQKDYIDLRPNDYWNSHCFWIYDAPQNFDEYIQNKFNRLSNSVSLIVFADLNKADTSKTYDYTEDLKIDVLNIIQNAVLPGVGDSLAVNQVFNNENEVYTGFSVNTETGSLRGNFTGFRISVTLNYLERCI